MRGDILKVPEILCRMPSDCAGSSMEKSHPLPWPDSDSIPKGILAHVETGVGGGKLLSSSVEGISPEIGAESWLGLNLLLLSVL